MLLAGAVGGLAVHEPEGDDGELAATTTSTTNIATTTTSFAAAQTTSSTATTMPTTLPATPTTQPAAPATSPPTTAPSSGLAAGGTGEIAAGQAPTPETGGGWLVAPGLACLGLAFAARRAVRTAA